MYVYSSIQDAKVALRAGPGDMRNRVVGSRLVRDGIDPYTFHYKVGDSLQYFDFQNCKAENISNISASPFFLKILTPICHKPQLWINSALYIVTQIAFCVLLLVVIQSLSSLKQKAVAAFILISTLYWDAWLMNLFNKQTYFLFAIVYFIIFLLLRKNYFTKVKTQIAQSIAGALIAFLVLLKMNLLLLFLPFIFIAKKIKTTIVTASILIIVYIGIVFTHSYSRNLWTNYFSFLKVSIAQVEGKITNTKIDQCPNPPILEGINIKKITDAYALQPISYNEETANFFNILWFINKSTIERSTLSIIMMVVVGMILGLSIYVFKKNGLSVPQIFLLGFACYLIADFFGPIFRLPYYTTQWYVAIGIMLMCFKNIPKWSWVFLILAFLLYLSPIVFSNLQLTLAEQFLLLAILGVALYPKNKLSVVAKEKSTN
jgi:hypothetical protein